MRGGGGDGLPVPHADAGSGGLPGPRPFVRAATQVRAADPRAGPQGVRGGPGQGQDAGMAEKLSIFAESFKSLYRIFPILTMMRSRLWKLCKPFADRGSNEFKCWFGCAEMQ